MADDQVPVLVGLGAVSEESLELLVDQPVVSAGAGDGVVSRVRVHPDRHGPLLPCGLEGVHVSLGGDLQGLIGADLVRVFRYVDEVRAEQNGTGAPGGDEVGN